MPKIAIAGRPLNQVKADLFAALAHPVRVRILELLRDGERPVKDLLAETGAGSSHLSQQLGVLRRAGLVRARREGSLVYYSIKDKGIVRLLAVARTILLSSLTETREILSDLEETTA